ncbi:hypothetical protein ACN2CC_28125 [Mesorhizobium muleiense]|uniref:hypothetical protein n=1 Tax=Mesorhizobium muleiense TaxID=1004279 RepID=UPI003AFB0597
MAQAGLRRTGPEGVAAEAEFQARKHRPAFNSPQSGQRPSDPAGRLAAWRVDQPQRVTGNEDTGADTGFTQQPFKPLMRAGLPLISAELPARVGIKVRMNQHQNLRRHVGLTISITPQQRHVRLQQRAVLGQGSRQL